MNSLLLQNDIAQIFNKAKENESVMKEFKCPCGKAYFSYPAIFTHIKNKHGGKPPGDIIKPLHKDYSSKLKLKKAKKFQIGGFRKQEESTTLSPKQEYSLMDFIYFLIKIGSDLPVNINNKKNKFYLNILYETGSQQGSDKQKQTKNSPALIIKFIKQLEKQIGINNGIISSLILLFSLFCNSIDRTYSPLKKGQEYSHTLPSQDLVYFANNFMTNYAPDAINKYKLQVWEFFKIQNIIKILEYFFRWLYNNGHSQKYLALRKYQNSCKIKKQQTFD